MNRGRIGTMPLGDHRDDDSYLDFVEGIRVFNASKVGPVMLEKGNNAVEAFARSHGRQPESIDEVKAAVEALPIVNSRNRIWRWSQESIWKGVEYAYQTKEAEFAADLDRYDKLGPGSVTWDPNFRYPDYFASVDFHIQPGGYYSNPLAGYIYHYGTKVFNTGRNNNDEMSRGRIGAMPLPNDGQVRRILDLGCSIGQQVTAWKERFPQAEVWGLDAGAPMVRYAHKRAVDMGSDVHFIQALCSETGFPDNYFDIVSATILFHEIPEDIIHATVAEAHRILRPGGYFVVIDFPNRPRSYSAAEQVLMANGNPGARGLDLANAPGRTAAMAAYTSYIDGAYNGEPYAAGFIHMDFTSLLQSHFSDVNPNFEPGMSTPVRIATK